MRQFCAIVLMMCAGFLLVGGTNFAGDKKGEGKAVVLKGTITCAKCDLGVESKCATVIVVKDKDQKDVVYYFDKAGNKTHHSEICQAPKKGSVEGAVSADGTKKVVTVKKVTFE